MEQGITYDVFVSYSRKDYVDEHKNPIEGSPVAELLNFLNKHHISYWFDKDGVYSGSEFVEVITDAITSSKMLIFVSSKNSNASKYTAGEIFEALDQEKIIVPFKIDNSQYNKKFRMLIRPFDFIEYFENPDTAFESLLKTVNIIKGGDLEEILKEIEALKAECLLHSKKLEEIATSLISKYKSIGEDKKICPVCSQSVNMDIAFCERCGWTFNLPYALRGAWSEDHLSIAKTVWRCFENSNVKITKSKEKIEELQSKVHSLEEELKGTILPPPPPEEKGVFSVGDVKFKMIYVEGGTFTMGATPEMKDGSNLGKPAHMVTLSSYSIGETPVTQALWRAVMGNNPSYFKGENLPVEQVSWNDCQEFIKRLSDRTGRKFRLLTEAEWEFAARGGNKSRRTPYSGSDKLNEVAWYRDNNSGNGTQLVRRKKPNELGIYDMTGNVLEWCNDWYSEYSKHPQTNPEGPGAASCRVSRGGSWSNTKQSCHIANRGYYAPHYRANNIGFRLALSECMNEEDCMMTLNNVKLT